MLASDYFIGSFNIVIGFPWWLRQQCRRPGVDPWVEEIPWRKEWLPTPLFLFGESHGQRSLVGYSPRGQKESDTTEWLSTTIGVYKLYCL